MSDIHASTCTDLPTDFKPLPTNMMHPDYTSPNHWFSLPPSWFLPQQNPPSYYSVPGFHSEPARNSRLYPDPFMLDPAASEKPASRVPHLMRAVSPGPSPDYCHSIKRYYPRGTGQHDVFSPVDRSDGSSERAYFNQPFENGETSLEDPVPLDNSGPLLLDDKVARPRRGRTVFSGRQLHELETVFINHQYISGQQRKRLSVQLGITETQVRVWFQNRRIKWRKQMLERTVKS